MMTPTITLIQNSMVSVLVNRQRYSLAGRSVETDNMEIGEQVRVRVTDWRMKDVDYVCIRRASD